MPFVQDTKLQRQPAAGAFFVKALVDDQELTSVNLLLGKANNASVSVGGKSYETGRLVYLNFYGAGEHTEESGLVFRGNLEFRPIAAESPAYNPDQCGDFLPLLTAIQQASL